MLDLSFEKLFVLAVVAMFILGPERLPAAAAWLGRTVRQVKGFAQDANDRIRSEIGPEFDEIRTPLRDLRAQLGDPLSWSTPQAALRRHLLDDPVQPAGYVPEPTPVPHIAVPQAPVRLRSGERPPIDPDAT